MKGFLSLFRIPPAPACILCFSSCPYATLKTIWLCHLYNLPAGSWRKQQYPSQSSLLESELPQLSQILHFHHFLLTVLVSVFPLLGCSKVGTASLMRSFDLLATLLLMQPKVPFRSLPTSTSLSRKLPSRQLSPPVLVPGVILLLSGILAEQFTDYVSSFS